jgi:hypothetical protein
VFSDSRGSSDAKFIWQTPICLANPASPVCDPSCQIETNEHSGTIRIDGSNYENRRSCLWTIRVAATHRLVFEFEKEDGFGLEYHEYCGYDKLHVFSGSPTSELYRHASLVLRFFSKNHNFCDILRIWVFFILKIIELLQKSPVWLLYFSITSLFLI